MTGFIDPSDPNNSVVVTTEEEADAIAEERRS